MSKPNQTRFVGPQAQLLANALKDLGYQVVQVAAGPYCARHSTAWETTASQDEAMRVASYPAPLSLSYSPVPQDGCR